MGKLVQVKATVPEVRLPPLSLPFLAYETTTLTDAEYNGLDTATKAAIVVVQSGLANPVRSTTSTTTVSTAADAYKLSKQYTDAAIAGLTTLGISPPSQMATHTEVATGDTNTLASARTYTDSRIITEANTRAAGDTTTLNSAKAYTDSSVAGIDLSSATNAAKSYTDTQIGAEVTRANSADTMTLNAARSYTDTKDSAQATAIVNGDATTLTSARTYTDTSISGEVTARTNADSTNLTTAKQYADTIVSTEGAARTTADANTLASAKTYTDNSVASEVTARGTATTAALNSAKSYTDTGIANEVTARNAADASTLASAHTYTDSAVSGEASARTSADATTLAAAKAYSDSLGASGGAVLYTAQALTIAQKALAQKNLGLAVTAEQYGAKGDGTTNDTAAMQAAVDALSAQGGGVLNFGSRHYVVGGLILKTGVQLISGGTYKNGGSTYTALFTPPSGYTGWIIDSPSTAIAGAGVTGLSINGGITNSSSPNTGGIRIQSGQYCTIDSVVVAATSLGSVNIVNGVANLVRDCSLQNFWQFRPALTQNEGTLTVGGTDSVIKGNQCNGGDQTVVYDPVNFYRCGLLLNAWTSWVFEGNGEYADVGVKVTGKLNKLTSVRADVNAGRGIQVDYFGNILSDVTVISNSAASFGTYDGIYLGSIAYNTTIDGVTSGDFFGAKHRYVVNDQVNYGSDLNAIQALPIIENIQAIDDSYSIDLINHLAPMRAMLPPGAGSPLARPAARYMHGNGWYDTDNNKPTFSDGVHWRDIGGDISGNILAATRAEMIGPFVSSTQASDWGVPAGSTLALVSGWSEFRRPRALAISNAGSANSCGAQISYQDGIIGGRTYTFLGHTYALTQAAGVVITVAWYDAGLNLLSYSAGPSTNNATTAETVHTYTLTAPPTATGFAISFTFTRTSMVNGETHHLTKVGAITGSTTDFVAP